MEEKTEEKLTVQKLEEVRDKFVEWVKEKMPNSCQNLDELKNAKIKINDKGRIDVGSSNSLIPGKYCNPNRISLKFIEILSDIAKKFKSNEYEWEINNGKAILKNTVKGEFFEEATTMYMASKFAADSQNEDLFEEMKKNKFRNLSENIIEGLASKLAIEPIKLCEYINKKHSIGDTAIDKLCEKAFGDKSAFEKIETSLDYYTNAMNKNGIDINQESKLKKNAFDETSKNANTLLKYSINKIFNQSEFGQQLLNENLLETTEPNNLKEEKNKKKRRMGFFARIRNWFFGRKKKNKNNENQATGAVAETAHIKKVGKSELADAKREMASREPESILQEVINKRNETQSSESSNEKQFGEND